jgi:hypothetical protein
MGLSGVAISSDGSKIVLGSSLGRIFIWRVFPTTQDLVDYAQSVMPRRLTEEQRQQFFLVAN